MTTDNRIDQLINDRYPGKLEMIHRVINIMRRDYDTEQFLDEDITENILMELDII